MKAGKKSDNTILLIVLILGVAYFGGFFNNLNFQSIGASQEAVGSCVSEGARPVISASAYWVDPTQNNKQTQLATTIVFAKTGSSLIFNTTTGSATASSDTSVPCGSPVTVLAGDGGGTTYYYNGVSFDATGVSHSVSLEVKKSGAASIAVHNDTATGWASTILLGNNSIVDPDTSIAVRVNPPTTAGAHFGDLGWALCVKYNSLNFTNVYPQPNNGLVSIPHVGGTVTNDAVRCYEMPGILVSGGNPYYGTLYLDKVNKAFSNSTISVDVTLVDKTSGLFNGAVYTGYDSSAAGGDGQNTDLGRADVSTTSLLNVTGVPA